MYACVRACSRVCGGDVFIFIYLVTTVVGVWTGWGIYIDGLFTKNKNGEIHRNVHSKVQLCVYVLKKTVSNILVNKVSCRTMQVQKQLDYDPNK